VADSTTAEEIAIALGLALMRKGILDADDLARAADGSASADAAHALRSIAVEGGAPSQSEWEAGQRRAQIRVVKD